jgi:very-short-patch-repair endonuclease
MDDATDRHDPRTARARSLRRSMTAEERLVWAQLKLLDIDGHFRRQVPIGPWFADFAHLGARVVVELDGGHHGRGTQAAHDARRDAWFAANGFRVLRFWNSDVHDNLEGVIDTILHALAGFAVVEIHPPMTPSGEPPV